MLRGELHNRGSAGRCEACGEIFPCPTGLAIYEAVKRELEPAAPPRQITDHRFQPMRGRPEVCDWTGSVIDSPCRWPVEMHALHAAKAADRR